MKTIAFFLTMLVPAIVSAQEKPTTGYAPVNGLKMYYEVHGSGEPVVLLHGAFMTITGNWTGWIGELSKTRKVIAVEMQGHGRTADIERDISSENLADDVAALLDYLKIPSADVIGYSMGGGVAMQCAIRHPEKVRKVVSISAAFRRDGWVKEALDAFPKLTAEAFKGSPIEAEYKKLSPTPDEFPEFVKHVVATASKAARLRRRQAQGHQGADVLHPRRCRRRAARSHRGNVPPEGWRDSRRHAAALRIAIGHFARHDTRHADGPHGRDRPDGERLSRCQAAKAMRKLYSSLQARD